MPDNSKKIQKAAEFWDQNCKVEVSTDYWTCHPIINEYVNSLIAPGAGNILEWFRKKYVGDRPYEKGISLGCGTGAADRQALQAGICLKIDGIDVSLGSIEVAKREAVEAGLADRLSYAAGDINSLNLPQASYDFALFVGSLHHIENLEFVINELKKGLKPNSYIFINEYVGPTRLQWTKKQVDILNRVWEVMPSEYRKPGPLAAVVEEDLIRVDPSEAVRSSEIVPMLSRHFEVLDHIEYGGSFLMPFWSQGIVPEVFLDDPNKEKQVIIKLLCVIEELVREEKILPNCYAQIVARNNPASKSDIWGGKETAIADRRKWASLWISSPPGINELRESYIRKAFHVLKTEGLFALTRKVVRFVRRNIFGAILC